MVEYSVEVGRVVESKAGRDKGRLLIITGIVDEQYVTIADGDLRVLERPKKKKLKHLRLRPQILSSIAEKLASGTKVFDAELRSALRAIKDEENA
ncbi:MAG: RNA-binding protein [Christensenellales bacterium]|jgi:large subunit ribosomal protein L14e